MPAFCSVVRQPPQSPVSVSRFSKVSLRVNLSVFSNSFRKLHRSTKDEGAGASVAADGGVAGLSKFTPSAKLTAPPMRMSMSIARKVSSASARLKTLRPITKSKTAGREKVNVFASTVLPSWVFLTKTDPSGCSKTPEVRVKDVARRFGSASARCTNRWVPWPRRNRLQPWPLDTRTV